MRDTLTKTPSNIHNLAGAGAKFDVCDILLRLFDTLWVDLPFSRCHQKYFIYPRFMSGNDFTWFLVYAEVFDQYISYVLCSIDMFQKRQMRSDTQIRMSEYDEMGGASI